jgi:glucokinase-like ROK family protein
VFHRFKQRVESRDPLIEVDQLERAVRYLLDQTPRYGPPTPVAGVGIGITGVIDPEEGVWRYSPHYQVRDLPVAPMLQERLSLPVWIENDARAMAWGERSFGAAQGVDNLAFIRVGVGLGAGIIIDGRLYGGAHQGAGEIGHIMVKERGLRCRCGSDGCLETVGSAIAIARRAVQRMAQGEETLIRELCGGDPSKVIATTVIEAADAGDRVAQEILSEAGRFLGIGIGAMINLLNPAMVIIGGGTSRAGDYLIEPLRQAALERTLPALRERVKIVRTELGEDAGPLGGAALVIEELFRTPTLK